MADVSSTERVSEEHEELPLEKAAEYLHSESLKEGKLKTSILTCLGLLALVIACGRSGTVSNTNHSVNQYAPVNAAASPAVRSERGTPDEAKTMLEKAIEHYNAVGQKQALADFNGRKSPFFDRDLYVVCIGPDQRIAANGGFPQYVGSNASILRDAEGRPLGGAILKSLESDGIVRFKWINPVSGKTEPKIGFFRKVGDLVCGVGAYNP